MKRQLSAILAADMVGYSRLMEADEAGTIERQKAHLSTTIKPLIKQYRGRVVKLMGDGILVEFASVIDAVKCAVAVQRAVLECEATIPDERRIEYRVGINLGDVFFDDGDMFGDGVNIAARLEQLAEPGGICISGTVYDHLKSNIKVGYESLGEVKVKNIEQAVRVYRVLTGQQHIGSVVAEKSTASGARTWILASSVLIALIVGGGVWWWVQNTDRPNGTGKVAVNNAEELSATSSGPAVSSSDRPSIAVLPFDNLSGDPGQDYFSDGMTEDLITDLSQVSGLFVLARNTAFTYKGRAVNVRDVGRELGVKYVLEGSVRKSGDRVRINAQLIDAKTGGHLWANRFDRKLTDVFALQDDVVQKIVEALAITLKAGEKARLTSASQVNPEAYDTLLRGLEKFRRFSRETNIEAREFFEQAIALDPKFARAHADLALTYALAAEQHWTREADKSAQLALKIANDALALDSSVTQVHFVLSVVYRTLRRIDESTSAARQAIAFEPNYADGHAVLAISLNVGGSPKQGLAAIRQATKLNPRKPFFYVWTEGQSHYLLGNYEEAARLLEQVIVSNPQFPAAHKLLAATYIELGRVEDAKWAAAELLTIATEFNLASEKASAPYTDEAVRLRYIENLRKAGVD